MSHEQNEEPIRNMREGNHGIDEGTAVLARGAAFAFPAYFVGKWIAKFFESDYGVRTGAVQRSTGIAFAAIAGILGGYQASRDARAGKKQLERLQNHVGTLEAENASLKDAATHSAEEIHTQAERIEPGHDPEQTQPATHVAAGDAEHDTLAHSQHHARA